MDDKVSQSVAFQKYVILDSSKTSDYQYSSNDDGRHRFAKDGWDYYKTVFEVDGVKFEGLVNIAKSGNKKLFMMLQT